MKSIVRNVGKRWKVRIYEGKKVTFQKGAWHLKV